MKNMFLSLLLLSSATISCYLPQHSNSASTQEEPTHFCQKTDCSETCSSFLPFCPNHMNPYFPEADLLISAETTETQTDDFET